MEIMLGQINTNNMQLTSAICICRDSHSATFDDACMYMSRQIATIFPQFQPNAVGKKTRMRQKPTYRGISSIKTTKNGKVICNGVDLTDTTKYFNKADYQKMGKEGHDFLNKCPKRKAAKEAHALKKKQKGSDDSNRHVAAIINGVIQATCNETESVAGSSIPSQVGGTTPRMPQHGSHARNSSAVSNANTTLTTRQYDHNVNVVPGS